MLEPELEVALEVCKRGRWASPATRRKINSLERGNNFGPGSACGSQLVRARVCVRRWPSVCRKMQHVSGYSANVFDCQGEVGAKLAAKVYDVRWSDHCLGACWVFHRDACQRWCRDIRTTKCRDPLQGVDRLRTACKGLVVPACEAARLRCATILSLCPILRAAGVQQLFCDLCRYGVRWRRPCALWLLYIDPCDAPKLPCTCSVTKRSCSATSRAGT